jgi:hypothetical protein
MQVRAAELVTMFLLGAVFGLLIGFAIAWAP